MIICRGILHETGIDLLFSKSEMVWDNASVPMQELDKLSSHWVDQFEQELVFAHDPITADAERIQHIIDAKYTKAHLPSITKECDLLSNEEKDQLLQLLQKFEHLFDGTLGSWNVDPVDLELKDPEAKPSHARAYPVPHSQEKQLKEDIDRLCGYEKDQ